MVTFFLMTFVVLLCLGTPIALVLSGSALAYFLVAGASSPAVLVQTVFSGLQVYPLLAVPLFILAGNLMAESGMLQDLINFSRKLVGHMSGGLGLVTMVTVTFFGAICGAAVAAAVAIGGIMLPAMKQAGYDEGYAAGLVAVGSLTNPLIPPSVAMIQYAVIANLSIASLFVAGIIPGCVLGLSLGLYAYVVAKRRGYPVADRGPTFKEFIVTTVKASPALMMPVLVFGGIVLGWYTPTEAAGISVLYAVVVGVAIYKGLKLSKMPKLLLQAAMESSVVMLLLGMSEPASWIVAVERIPEVIINLVATVNADPWVILLFINIALLLIGIPLETAPAIAILAPVLAPLAGPLGIDPIQLALVVIFNLIIGLVTPPVGGVLFAVCAVGNIRLEKISKAVVIPFFIAVLVLFMMTYIPAMTLYLPHLLLK